ncbi:MAG: lactate utilization protein [Candidatus Omnitrophica bacterium]|jgi:hypothetical protein|nr:lactate utilization protein [Candidatus Omnitrophota bacterium]
MDKKIDLLIENWQKRNISGFYCFDKVETLKKLLELIPSSASVGLSGSVTLSELDVVAKLEARGNQVFDQGKPGISKEESWKLRQAGVQADYFLTSANAISEKGELVFLSAWGHRIAGISNAKNVIIVAGVNKLTPDLDAAIKRAREYATPLNYKRLNWDANRIMRCQILIVEAEAVPDRLKVILVGESLGF